MLLRRPLFVRVIGCALWLWAVPAVGQAQFQLPPPGDRSVHDLAGVLAPEHVGAMEGWHRELFRQTEVAIVVVTVPALDGEPVGDFALRVGTEWGVGGRDVDRGVVLALAVAERQIYISTGYGVEGFLPDGRVGGIIDDARSLLGQDQFSTGLLQMSAALVAAAADEYGITLDGAAGLAAQPSRTGRRPRGAAPNPLFTLLLLGGLGYMLVRHPRLLLLMLLFSGFGGRGMGRRGFGGGGFGGGAGFGGFGGGGFGGGGAGRGF